MLCQELITINGMRMYQYEMDSELGSNFIFDLFEDRNGYLWIGSLKGLLKYNGQEFQRLTKNPVETITEGTHDHLWFTENGGNLAYYDMRKDSVIRVDLEKLLPAKFSTVRINALSIGSPSSLYLGTNTGIIQLRITSDDSEMKLSYHGSLMDKDQITSLLHEDKNKLWIGTGRGLFKAKITQDGKHHVNRIQLPQISNSQLEVVRLRQGQQGRIWVMGLELGNMYEWKNHSLLSVNQTTNEVVQYNHNFEKYTRFNDLLEEDDGTLWIATKEQGLLKINYGDLIFSDKNTTDISMATVYDYVDGKDVNIGTPNFECLLKDRSGVLWGGTRFHGLFKIPEKINHFTYYDLPDYQKYANNGVANLLEDHLGNIWIATWINGVYYFNKDTRTFRHFGHIPGDTGSIASNNIHGILKDEFDQYWFFGENCAMSRYDYQTDKFSTFWLCPTSYDRNNKSQWEGIIVGLADDDSNGNLWIASDGVGLIKFDASTKELINRYTISEKIPNEDILNDQVTNEASFITAYVDSKEQLWVSHPWRGLYRAVGDLESGNIRFEHAISEINLVSELFEDSAGRFWAASFNTGLSLLDPINNKIIETYDEDSGFLHSSITKVAEDAEGILWMACPKGLIRFNPDTGEILNFDNANGLKNNSRLLNPTIITSSDELIMGGAEGIYLLNLKDVDLNNTVKPKVNFSGLEISNEEIRPNDTGPLDQHINFTEKIVLKHFQNDLVITYNGLHFDNSEGVSYTHRLEGWNDNWAYVGDVNSARFPNLAPGDYTFQLKAQNSDGVWSETRNLSLTVLPAWWETNLAWFAYVLIFASLVYFLYRFQLGKKIREEENKQLQELNVARTKLYTNITHEFRTPLTAIKGMAESLLTTPKGLGKKGVDIIVKNSNQLLTLVNQLLELQKLEAEKLTVSYTNKDIVGFLKYLCESFHSLAREKNVLINFKSEESTLMMDIDEKKIQHIISNLISNAIKFANPDTTIKVRLKTKNKMATISVRDSGMGIPPGKLDLIFERFYQVDDESTRKAEGTGIGLTLTKELVLLLGGTIEVSSKLNVGSIFTVNLPIKNDTPEPAPAIARQAVTKNQDTFLEVQPDPIINRIIKGQAPLVLIVEDNKDVAYYIGSILGERYRTEHAKNGKIGLEKAIKLVPDIIVSDVMMPEMDGFELTSSLTSDYRTDHIPIILLTAKADDPSRFEGLFKGADAYLIKPFKKEELLIRVDKLIEKKKRLQAKFNQAFNVSDTKNFPAFVFKLNEVIDKHLSDDSVRIDEYARALAMSRVQLHRKVKALTGLSSSLYIKRYKLRKAYDLLMTTELNTSQIAIETGFSSLSHFSRSFKEIYGVTPSKIGSDKTPL